MIDCSKDILAYHNEEVTLQQTQRTGMRNRRDANRRRLLSQIPIKPNKFIKQGSYAMLTMVQDNENDYDIDDGVYFTKESLQDAYGNDMSPSEAREMVCESLKDEKFKKQPVVKTNCVRIFYTEGYHVDMPVYRINNGIYELASGDSWRLSRSAEVEEWFYTENENQSPDTENGRQLRRIVRFIKKLARSRQSWKKEIASGFVITKLVTEKYIANLEREDISLIETMKAIYLRLDGIITPNLEVFHPIMPGTYLTTGQNDTSTAFLRDKLKEAVNQLEVLKDPDCSRVTMLNTWNIIFNTSFFSNTRTGNLTNNSNSILGNLVANLEEPNPIEKHNVRFA